MEIAFPYGTFKSTIGTYYDSSTTTNGCDSIHSTVLTINPTYNISDLAIAICNGDSISIYGTFRSTAGTYYDSSTTVNGCDSIHSTVLTVNPTYSITDPAIAICNGDSISIYGTFRSVGATYYDNLTTTNGCDSIHSTVLTVNPAYNISDPGVSICNGDSAIIYGTFRTTAGTYYDSLTTVDGCDSIHSTVLSVNPNPSKPAITQNGNTLSSTTANSYQWFFNGDTIIGATSQFYTATQSGFYTVTIFDNNGCSSTSDPLSVTISNIQEIESVYGLKIYPNPNTGQFVVEMNIPQTGNYLIKLFNSLGQEIFTTELKKFNGIYKKQLDLRKYQTGIYDFQLITDKGTVNKKIILE